MELDMYLTRELLLPYHGLDAFDGLCHVRTYEQVGRLPVVIAGGLDDNPGISIGLVIELVAAAVQRSEFPDGREFYLIEHYRDAIDGRLAPIYSLVHFDHHPLQDSPDIEVEFRGPRWAPIDDVERLLGCKLTAWEQGLYTARAIAGEQGERLRSELAENGNRIRAGIFARLDATCPDDQSDRLRSHAFACQPRPFFSSLPSFSSPGSTRYR
jgi:hypothetical protein